MGLLTFFSWLWNGLRQLLGLVLPVFASARDFGRTSPVVLWTLRVLALAVFLGLLWVAQHFTPGLNKAITYPKLRDIWLPLLGLLLVVAMWLFRWLWLVWMTEEDDSEFPDIDVAWAEVLRALEDAHINLQEVPLYLVLGQPLAGEEGLFQGSGLPFTVKHVPARGDAPLRVYGNKHDGVFITCAGASRLGTQAGMLALTAQMLPVGLPEAPADGAEDDAAANATIGAGQNKMKQVQRLAQVLDAARRKGRSPSDMTEDERRQLVMLERADKPEEAARQTARLEHLCRLIVRARRPECPINGVLVLVPCAALYNDEDAEKTAAACRHDLQAAWGVFQLNCPLLALVCDLEKAPGFPEFLEGYLAHCRNDDERRKERKRRLGKRFGWGVDVEPRHRSAALEAETGWIGQGMFPIQIYQNLLRTEKPDREHLEEVTRRNSRLYRFMGLMRDGEKRLRRVVVHGLEARADGPALLGGCYLAATGPEPAFIAGVFQRLLEAQAFVSWTDKALAEDAAYYRMTRYGYGLLAVVVVASVALLYYWWPGQ